MADLHGKRKIEHLELSLRDDIVYQDTCNDIFNEVILIHNALPGLDYRDINTTTSFLGYDLKAPLVIEAITGGHRETKSLNEKLAMLASRFKIAIGVGSQRPIIKSNFNSEVIETYKIVREIAYDVPVIGNIGIAQLRELSIDQVLKLVDSINADALAVHLNPAQEIIQPEGDYDFGENLFSKLGDLVKSIGVPVIIKEVGNGLSLEVVKKLTSIGINYFDTAGSCGTNWIKIEAYRNRENSLKYKLGLELSRVKWGIPTPLSLIETRSANPNAIVIASGGVWSGIRAAQMLALGANLAGFARPVLKNLIEQGYESTVEYIEQYIEELKAIMFLTGSRKPSELCSKPIILGINIVNYMKQRGILVDEYIKKTRCSMAL